MAGIDEDTLWQSAGALRTMLVGREIRATDLVEAAFGRAARSDRELNFLCALDREGPLTRARQADKRLRTAPDSARALEGIPFFAKDLTPTRGLVTEMGSRTMRGHVPAESAVVIERLEAAGAILLGKTTTSEFANASVTESPASGITLNPWNCERTSGGSSGGSAVAVAMGCVPFAEGSDMGGSVRIPACFCGLVGLKPARGRIPFGFLPNAFDRLAHHGPIARTVGDAALFLEVTKGPSNRDPLSLPHQRKNTGRSDTVADMRVAASADFGFATIEPAVGANFESMLERLASAGAVIERVDPGFDETLYEAGLHIFAASITASYGHLRHNYRDELDPTLLRFFEVADGLSAVDLARADLVRSRHWHRFSLIFSDYNAFICPTMPRGAPPVATSEFEYAGKIPDGRTVLFDMTMPFNLFGQLPAVTIPSGLDPEGTPTGLQIIADRYDEETALAIAEKLHDADLWTGSLKDCARRVG